jgi:uncharacterized membrane protein
MYAGFIRMDLLFGGCWLYLHSDECQRWMKKQSFYHIGIPSLTSEKPMAEISSQKIQIAVLDMIAATSSNKRSAVALESVLKIKGLWPCGRHCL